MQGSTETATFKGGIDFSGILWGAIRRFFGGIVDKIPYHDWPYWKELGITCGGLALLGFLYWLWKNWIR
jgi:hypothetical protein